MNMNENVMITGEGEKSSPTTSPGFILELNNNMTKGEIVNVLKDIDNPEMLMLQRVSRSPKKKAEKRGVA